MKNLTTLGTAAFESKKQEAIRNEVMRKELNLSEFNVIDNTHIEIDGVKIELSQHAFGKLLGRLRIPKAFAKRFAEGFGNDGLKQLEFGSQRKVWLSHEDFDYLTEHGKFLNADGEMTCAGFEQMVVTQMRLYTNKKINTAGHSRSPTQTRYVLRYHRRLLHTWFDKQTIQHGNAPRGRPPFHPWRGRRGAPFLKRRYM